MPTRIPVEKLQVGMRVLREKPTGGFAKDCRLVKYFPTSAKFYTLSFVTESRQIVIWSRCGYVWIQ